MGHNEGAGGAKREVLLVLRRALSRHHLQPNDKKENALLHSEPDHPVRRHLVPVRARVLPAQRFWREDLALHLHLALAHCVLLATGRNHSAYVVDGTLTRQIPPVYYDVGDVVCSGDHRRAQRELSVSGHAQNGAVGAPSFFRTIADSALHQASGERGAQQRRGRGGQGVDGSVQRAAGRGQVCAVRSRREEVQRRLRHSGVALFEVRVLVSDGALFRGASVAFAWCRRRPFQPRWRKPVRRRRRCQSHLRQAVHQGGGEDYRGVEVHCAACQKQRLLRECEYTFSYA